MHLCNLCTSKSLARGTWNACIIRVGRNILTQAVHPNAERSTGTKFWHRWRATIGRGTPGQSTTRWHISYIYIVYIVDHQQKYNDTKRWQTEPGGSSKSILMIEISELQITSNHQLEASIETTGHLTLPGRNLVQSVPCSCWWWFKSLGEYPAATVPVIFSHDLQNTCKRVMIYW